MVPRADLDMQVDVRQDVALIRYYSNCYTLHRSDLVARAAPLDSRLGALELPCTTLLSMKLALGVFRLYQVPI